MTSSITLTTVRQFVRFQQTGDNRFFEVFWADAESFIEKTAKSWLVKHFVRQARGSADGAAVDDVKQRVAGKLLGLPGRADRAGWYDTGRFGWKPDRLRAWLWRVIRNEAVEHCKEFHGLDKREISTVTFSDLEFNEGGSAESVLKPLPKLDFAEFELREIVAECLAQLPEEDRGLYQMLFVEGLSQREVAGRVGTSAPTVCRRWGKLRADLEARLSARGVDATWLGQAA